MPKPSSHSSTFLTLLCFVVLAGVAWGSYVFVGQVNANQADLEVTVTGPATVTRPAAGQGSAVLIYTVTVRNVGTVAASNVSLLFLDLDPASINSGFSLSLPSGCQNLGGGTNLHNGAIRCALSSIIPLGYTTRSFVYTVDSATATNCAAPWIVQNIALVTTTTNESSLANNQTPMHLTSVACTQTASSSSNGGIQGGGDGVIDQTSSSGNSGGATGGGLSSSVSTSSVMSSAASSASSEYLCNGHMQATPCSSSSITTSLSSSSVSSVMSSSSSAAPEFLCNGQIQATPCSSSSVSNNSSSAGPALPFFLYPAVNPVSDFEKWAADVNGDNKITNADVTLLMRAVVTPGTVLSCRSLASSSSSMLCGDLNKSNDLTGGDVGLVQALVANQMTLGGLIKVRTVIPTANPVFVKICGRASGGFGCTPATLSTNAPSTLAGRVFEANWDTSWYGDGLRNLFVIAQLNNLTSGTRQSPDIEVTMDNSAQPIITNNSPGTDGTSIPTGVQDIGSFKFTVVGNGQGKVSSLIFDVTRANVQFEAGSFKVYNKANANVKVSCTALNESLQPVITQADTHFFVRCEDMDTTPVTGSLLSTLFSKTLPLTLVLEANVLNPQVAPESDSSLQVSLKNIARSNAYAGFGPVAGHMMWFNQSAPTQQQFTTNTAVNEVKSTLFEIQNNGDACTVDIQCDSDLCLNGHCSSCTTTSQCNPGEQCTGGHCVTTDQSCTSVAQCLPGQQCSNNHCVAVP